MFVNSYECNAFFNEENVYTKEMYKRFIEMVNQLNYPTLPLNKQRYMRVSQIALRHTDFFTFPEFKTGADVCRME